MKKRQALSSLYLLIASTIWGVAFVAQSEVVGLIGAYTFNCVRSFIGCIVLLPVIAIFGKKPSDDRTQRHTDNKRLLIYGTVCGTLLMIAANLQQVAMDNGATTGKAGFITACYIIFVPIIGLFMKRRCSPFIWLAVALATCGLYLLCMTDSLLFEQSDILLLACAVAFSLQIIAIDKFLPHVDCVKLACAQFFVCGLLSGIMMFIFEQPTFVGIIAAWKPILYTGALSSGVAYTLQIVGQKELSPAVASLIMSLESAIAAISGWLILGEMMSERQILGCVVMFVAIILAQLPAKKTA